MSTLEEALYAHLAADAAIAALVSTRIYPMLVPQDSDLPAIAYQRISRIGQHSHDGASVPARARIQITCLASTYSGAKALAGAVEDALDGYSGTVSSVVIDAFLDNELDEWAGTFDLPVVRQDYLIWYEE